MAGVRLRQTERQSEVQEIIQEQYSLGLLDLENERFERARQRFEYIIRLDPSFPEAPNRLAEALLGLNKPYPTATPPRATPTPNTSPAAEILQSAQQAYQNREWSQAIELLLSLRAKDPDFRAVEVDGLMYASLRNRGVHRISVDKQLEEGMYDLSLAESFAPLDEEAENWRSWSELYLTANSYFGLNWEQAVFYFELVYSIAPGIRNDVYWKYAYSLQRYADQLAAAGDPCAAIEQYELSLDIQHNEELVPTEEAVTFACMTATAPPTLPPATLTPTPTQQGGPAETPTPTITPTPSDTPGGGGS